jgi:nucleotide-binding universal stress UspA family protein
MNATLNVLVPVDGSTNSLLAVRHALNEYRADHALRLVLLNVQPPLSRHAARFLGGKVRHEWHEEKAEEALAPAKKLLKDAEVPFESQWVLGDRAEAICAAAKRLACHHIIMGTARKNSITRMLQDSTTNRVLESTPVPVEVVAGEQVSRLERWGLPAGVASSLGGLVYLALD